LTSRMRWNWSTEHHSISDTRPRPALFTTAHSSAHRHFYT
jgi:hypothetical protein